MNQNELIIRDSDPSEIKKLLRTINENIKLYHNGSQFIANNKLIEYKQLVNKKEHLPTQMYYGLSYLIKNNSIMQVESTHTVESVDVRIIDKHYVWRCTITIHNLDLSDVGEFSNTSSFVNMDELTSTNMDKSFDFILALVKNGFKIYLPSGAFK